MKHPDLSLGRSIGEELLALEEGTLDPDAFPHLEHVRLGFEMLCRHSFADAAVRFSKGLRRITAAAGKPEIYSETITIAFLALIGERLAAQGSTDWAEFIGQNPELADKNILTRWYEPEELKSEIARATFVLPRAKDSKP